MAASWRRTAFQVRKNPRSLTDTRMQLKPLALTMTFQRTVTTPLSLCLSPGVHPKVSAFSFYPTLLVAFRRGTELRLETPMRSECHESHGLLSLVPPQNLLHCTLKVVIPHHCKYSTKIEKRSFMRFQKRLLAGVRKGAMKRSSTGHAAHAKYVGQLSL